MDTTVGSDLPRSSWRSHLPGRQAPRREQGAVIVLVALLLTVVFTAAALSIDHASQVNEKQALHDTLDAGVHAGAYELPGSGNDVDARVREAIRASVTSNDAEVDVDAVLSSIQYFCVTASQWNGSTWVPASHTDGICHTPDITGRSCTEQLCSTPCNIHSAAAKCNTVRIGGDKPVDYDFAQVIGQDGGSTGALSSAACRGPCGELGSPLDIVIVVDRTTSMQETVCVKTTGNGQKCVEYGPGPNHVFHVRDALNGSGSTLGMLDLLEPDRHRVGIGTIHKASSEVGTEAVTAVNCRSTTAAGSGSWVPVGLTSSFHSDTATRDMVRQELPGAVEQYGRIPAPHEIPEPYRSALSSMSPLRLCVEVLPYALSSIVGNQTDFQGPIAAAADALLHAPSRPDGTQGRKAIIFMTDGEPNLPAAPCASGDHAAQQAKDDGVVIVTIAYRLNSTHSCGESFPYDTSMKATTLLSRMATQQGEGAGVDHCAAGDAVGENTDGDLFFCAPNPQDLLPVFEAALAAISENITLLRLPD